jgi:hypothetical protein
MWQTNDSKWKTSTGPSSLELKELGGREPQSNQCIGVVISSLRLDDATWQANFESLSSSSSGSERGAGAWGNLRRVISRDSWSAIRVNDNSGRTPRGLLDAIREIREPDLRHASHGGDGMLPSDELPDFSSIYIDVLPPPQITPSSSKNLNGEEFSPFMNLALYPDLKRVISDLR